MNARTQTLLRFAAPILLAFSTSAWAAEEQPHQTFIVPVSITVDATGLDLSSPSGAERLYRQIVSAAENACGSAPRAYKGVARRNYETAYIRPCIEGAVRAALAQVAAVTGRDLEQMAELARRADSLAASR